MDCSHSGQVHQHNTRIHTILAIKRVSCKSWIPVTLHHFSFGCHGRELFCPKTLKMSPEVFHWSQEKSICIHIKYTVHLLEERLDKQFRYRYCQLQDAIFLHNLSTGLWSKEDKETCSGTEFQDVLHIILGQRGVCAGIMYINYTVVSTSKIRWFLAVIIHPFYSWIF